MFPILQLNQDEKNANFYRACEEWKENNNNNKTTRGAITYVLNSWFC